MPYSKIIGTGSYLPEKIINNADLEKMVDTTDEWIMQRVGVRERHICGTEDTTNSMAEKAARKALAMAKVEPNEIDLIIVTTASSDYYFPSSACDLQQRLEIDTECPALDLNAACAGFVYGLSVANQYIRSGTYKTVLVVGVDALSTVVDWTDRATCILFGDGAGAVVLQASEQQGIINTVLKAAGEYGRSLYSHSSLWKPGEKASLYMEGNTVFKVAVRKLGEIVEQTLADANMQKSEIDWLIPHQANLRIISATAKRLELPMERVVLTIEEHGNTSAASIPLALDYAVRKGNIKRGDTLMLEAFGAGLAWGAALVKF
ncbi:MAG: ketoacyl-ACP synthase III [Gammaproteobacteria bacterium]|nr:ketoacyl-ACP synthase III [Gammaproteobacteria bacterium]